STKLIKCFEYGELTRGTYDEIMAWIFRSSDYEFVNINCTLYEALDDLSMEGWDLVCKDDLVYILRKPTEKEEPQPDVDDEED
ncbi:hypothetical protein, partial [Paenibacillus sp. AR247]|uniref:hypothetical protein n=1 Tax=Paenibacillus sp. AR247 TaxID=1631599 RepID=UPI000D4227D0